MQAETIQRPIFIDDTDQKVDDHPLHCSICCDVSFNPVLTPCNHVFCRSCIDSGLRSSAFCPNDRRPLHRNQLRDLTSTGSSLHEYIYDRTLVQCPNCDNWKGPMKKYKDHIMLNCTRSPYVLNLERKIQELQVVVTNKQTAIDTLQGTLARGIQAANSTMEAQHAQEKERMQATITALQASVSSLESRLGSMGPAFDPAYRYDQGNVADLSRIISRYLFNKPQQINPNRIFNCIKKCYDETFRDDCGRLPIDVRMLLATSYASNWFSCNQDGRFLEWYREISRNA